MRIIFVSHGSARRLRETVLETRNLDSRWCVRMCCCMLTIWWTSALSFSVAGWPVAGTRDSVPGSWIGPESVVPAATDGGWTVVVADETTAAVGDVSLAPAESTWTGAAGLAFTARPPLATAKTTTANSRMLWRLPAPRVFSCNTNKARYGDSAVVVNKPSFREPSITTITWPTAPPQSVPEHREKLTLRHLYKSCESVFSQNNCFTNSVGKSFFFFFSNSWKHFITQSVT